MPTLLLSKPEARPEDLIVGPGSLDLDAQSEEGRKVREAAWEARRLWRGRAVLQLLAPLPVTALAERILRTALERYRRPDGYEGHLVEAAWQLEQMGREAWPVLRDLVLAGALECEYFLGAVVRLEGVAPQHRLPALLAAARNPDANVRSRLLELLEEMPNDQRREVLQELRAEGRPDDGVTDRAREAGPERAS
jgi:hypothetical protein